ncbi:MAG: hypothetical protein VKL20_03985, partial [Synechocystis sp.]|nr:hypothetical protein [Synechocystis sp.]
MSSPKPPVQDPSNVGSSLNEVRQDPLASPPTSRFSVHRLRQWWTDHPKPPLMRLLGVAGLTLASVVGLDILCAPLTPLSR